MPIDNPIPAGAELERVFAGCAFAEGPAADAAGNFFVATGLIGTTLCGPSGNGLVGITARLDRAGCFPLNATVVNSQDMALSPRGDAAYLTVTDATGLSALANVVLRFSSQ